MPAIELPVLTDAVRLFMWKITESMTYFLDRTKLTEKELEEMHLLKGKRQLEYVVQRYLSQYSALSGFPNITKTSNGKPFFDNAEDKISISHTREFLIMSLAKEDHGVDLEMIDKRIIRLAYKFCNDREMEVPDYSDASFWFTLIWSCKESLYKCDGLGYLSFRDQLELFFTPASFADGRGKGQVRRETHTTHFDIFFIQYQQLVVTLAYPINPEVTCNS